MPSTDTNPTPRWTLLSALVLGLPFLLLFAYNYSTLDIQIHGTPLKKIDAVDSLEIWESMFAGDNEDEVNRYSFPWLERIESDYQFDSTLACPIPFTREFLLLDSLQTDSTLADTAAKALDLAENSTILYITDTISFVPVEKSDSSEQRILLVGDSEAGGLVSLFNDYCVSNGHKLVATMVWNSATVYNYGYSTRVDDLIKQYQPTLVVIVLGLNELYARDLAKRAKAADMLRAKLGSTPYLWVGPANFMEDYGINKVYEQTATSERFVLSKNLNLPKGSDKRHPNREGYKIWMEHIARFVQASELYDFKFEIPKKFGNRITGKVIHSNAARDRGY